MRLWTIVPLLFVLATAPAHAAPAAPGSFAAYRPVPASVRPAVPAYTVAPGLANVVNRKQFLPVHADTMRLLEANGFAVIPDPWAEFFPIYESNRYEMKANFVTTDSILHNYHLLFSHLLRETERGFLAPELKVLVSFLLGEAQAQYTALAGTPWRNAAARNVGFLAVAARLLDRSAPLPAAARAEVEKELALIEAHQAISESPVMNIGREGPDVLREDYTQYIVRGHYERDPRLRAYFRAMMWLGRMTFRARDLDETRSALLLTLILARREAAAARWERIYAPITFFVGRTDDASFPEYRNLVLKVYGQLPSGALLRDEGKLKAFQDAARKLPAPRINTLPVFNASIEPDRDDATRGFRLMGQRFTIDAAVLQQLTYRAVGNKEGNLNPQGSRYLPSGLDVPAAMGSQEAYRILDAYGETRYFRYPENMAKVKQHLAGLPETQWTENLYWGWLHALRPLLIERGAGYPQFMRNRAWVRKELNAFLGSWAELKHDTILYAKQVMVEGGGGGDEEIPDDRGYVEPQPEVYARLAALTDMTRRGLESRKLLGRREAASLRDLEEICLRLKSIAEKELRNAALSKAEYDFIRGYGERLEKLWVEALRDEGVKDPTYLNDNPAAVIADIATDPGQQKLGTGMRALHVGIGHIETIYVVFPLEGKPHLASGGVFSYYEFARPAAERLTDSQWRKLLDEGKAPARPSWVNMFIGHTNYEDENPGPARTSVF